MFGWQGKSIWVDMTTENVKEITIPQEWYREYLGGSGFGFRLLWKYLNPEIKPYDPDNLLIFAVGPLTGTEVYGAGRHSVISISPLTNTVFDSTSGGFFGAYMKFAGLDTIVISGAAESPKVLRIYEDEIEFIDGQKYWSMNTYLTTKTLRKELGSKYRIATIGPAGENLVRYASIINDPVHAAGRGGLGAIMGSKKLKAIAIGGKIKPKIGNKEKLDKLLKNMRIRITWNPLLGRALPEFGTASLLNLINELGMLPTKNFNQGVFEDAENISGESLKDKVLKKRKSCYNCPIACKRVTETENMKGDGPEYESIVNLGSMVLLNDIRKVTELNYICNELGLDTISMGGTLACALELTEIGALDKKLNWGDYNELVKAIKEVAFQNTELGKDLALGSKELSRKYKNPDISVQVKGLEMPAYDPRGAMGMALTYGTSYRGACHLRSWTISFEVIGVPNLIDRFSVVEKPSLVAYTQNLSMVYDSLVMCQHYGVEFDEEPLSDILTAVTGEEFTQSDLISIGERIWNLTRLMNIKRGFEYKDDMLPPKIMKPLKDGPSAGKVPPYEAMLKQYYEVRGWNEDGVPHEATLKRLGLYNLEGKFNE